MNNIILIGMPGCGKSTIGVVLAKNLGFRFIDSDLLIQEQEHRLLHEIIEQDGLDGFNRIENQVNASIDTDSSAVLRSRRDRVFILFIRNEFLSTKNMPTSRSTVPAERSATVFPRSTGCLEAPRTFYNICHKISICFDRYNYLKQTPALIE